MRVTKHIEEYIRKRIKEHLYEKKYKQLIDGDDKKEKKFRDFQIKTMEKANRMICKELDKFFEANKNDFAYTGSVDDNGKREWRVESEIAYFSCSTGRNGRAFLIDNHRKELDAETEKASLETFVKLETGATKEDIDKIIDSI